MRKVLMTAVAVGLLLAGQVYAADGGAVPAAKIGVVDMQTVATQSVPAQAAKTTMESKFGTERNELEKQGEALKKKADALKNPKASEEKKLDFIRSKQDLDQVTLVFSATYEVARAKGFNFVVDVPAGGVLYADQSMDLTQDVLAEVNKIYKEKANEKSGKK